MSNTDTFVRNLRKPPETEPSTKKKAAAGFVGEEYDWRVSLSVPPEYIGTDILKPLSNTGDKLIFPYNPTILINHSVTYNPLQPIHSNYPFLSYQNSQVDDMTITGEFIVQNSDDAQYWIAAVHYLRSITKMAYGQSPNNGAPPVLVRLNGYGDYVFPDVPVAIRSFSVQMNADVDFIRTQVKGKVLDGTEIKFDSSNGVAWVPTRSDIAVTVSPVYSRAKVSEFNLKSFIDGDYVENGGFI